MSELSPQVICPTETMVGENEKVKIPGYDNSYNSNESGKGGIIIVVQNELEEVTIETDKTLGGSIQSNAQSHQNQNNNSQTGQ